MGEFGHLHHVGADAIAPYDVKSIGFTGFCMASLTIRPA
jgi:hypothetical protein